MSISFEAHHWHWCSRDWWHWRYSNWSRCPCCCWTKWNCHDCWSIDCWPAEASNFSYTFAVYSTYYGWWGLYRCYCSFVSSLAALLISYSCLSFHNPHPFLMENQFKLNNYFHVDFCIEKRVGKNVSRFIIKSVLLLWNQIFALIKKNKSFLPFDLPSILFWRLRGDSGIESPSEFRLYECSVLMGWQPNSASVMSLSW